LRYSAVNYRREFSILWGWMHILYLFVPAFTRSRCRSAAKGKQTMTKRTCIFTVVLLLLSLAASPLPLAGQQQADESARQARGEAAQPRVQAAMQQLPLYFIENRGQVDEQVAYYLQGQDKTLYFTPQGVAFVLTGETPKHWEENGHDEEFVVATSVASSLRTSEASATSPQQPERWVLKLHFVGANPDVQPTGQDETPAVISYFKGPPEEWKTGLKTYSSLVYPDLWPGIDLAYSGTVNRLKYQFVVKPGADPSQIKLAYHGATAVRINEARQLEVSTPVGGFADGQPYAYQEMDGQQLPVEVGYVLYDQSLCDTDHETRSTEHVYGFRVGAYDLQKPLVLDPVILVYCGYIGGTGDDQGWGIAVDSAGNAYVTGQTASSEASFPETVGPYLPYNGNTDAFVAKVKANGTALVYCGYIGGSSEDWGYGIAVDSGGRVYIAGHTSSTESTFPVVVGPDLTYNGGSADAFVAKVKADGTGLVYCGYIGGQNTEDGLSIAVGDGAAYVAGATSSSEAEGFPVANGPDVTHNGNTDAFVAKVKADGTALVYCGYIGGNNGDEGYGIAVDSTGNAYVAGWTTSDEASFPDAVGPDLTFNGSADAFVAKVNPGGTALLYCGYIGGMDYEQAWGVAVDGTGSAYVTGYTTSGQLREFPVTGGPDLTYNGNGDAFVAKVKADGTALVYCGYIGGSSTDIGRGIGVDTSRRACITGYTNSTEASFPDTVGPDLTHNGGEDGFVARVKTNGSALLYCGYIGGSGTDRSYGIAVDGDGNAYVTGYTNSSQATFPVTVGPDLTHNGSTDAFMAKVGERELAIHKTDAQDPVQACREIRYTIRITNTGTLSLTNVLVADTLPSSAQTQYKSSNPPGTYDSANNRMTWTVASLDTGSFVTLTLKLRALATASGLVTNTVKASAEHVAPHTDSEATSIAANQRPSVGTVTPISSTAQVGVTKLFTTTYNDPNGYANLKWCFFLIGSSTALTNTVYLRYDQAGNKLWLRNNNDTTWLGGYATGSANTIQNGQAILDCSQTTVTKAGNQIKVHWAIKFKGGYTGNKNLYLKVMDICGLSAGWTKKGTVTINP